MNVNVRKHENYTPHAEAMCHCCTEADATTLDFLELEMLINFIETSFVSSLSPGDDIDYVIIMMNILQKMRSAYEMMAEDQCCE